MLALPCCEGVGCWRGRVDFHTQAGDDAAPPEAHADANRLRDAVNMIFGMQGAHVHMQVTLMRSNPHISCGASASLNMLACTRVITASAAH